MSGALYPSLRLADLARGDLASLRAFLSGRGIRGTSLAAQLDARLDTEWQDTLLTWATRHGQAEAVRLLLEGGASVGATNDGGASALLLACAGDYLECVRLLLEAGAAMDQADEQGATPLFIASDRGHLEVARLLLEVGAAVDRAMSDGTTPLSAASFNGEIDCVRLACSSRLAQR